MTDSSRRAASQRTAVLMAVGAFALFSAFIVVVFVLLDVRWLFAIAPMMVVAASSVVVYRRARAG